MSQHVTQQESTTNNDPVVLHTAAERLLYHIKSKMEKGSKTEIHNDKPDHTRI